MILPHGIFISIAQMFQWAIVMWCQVAHDVATGLAYLHPSVVHRDLKPHNVLLEGPPQAGRAKVHPALLTAAWNRHVCMNSCSGFDRLMLPTYVGMSNRASLSMSDVLMSRCPKAPTYYCPILYRTSTTSLFYFYSTSLYCTCYCTVPYCTVLYCAVYLSTAKAAGRPRGSLLSSSAHNECRWQTSGSPG